MRTETKKHRNIALSGKMGSGKSTIAKLIAEQGGYQVASIGTTIKELGRYLVDEDRRRIDSFLARLTVDKERQSELHGTLRACAEKERRKGFVRDEQGHLIKNEAYRSLLQNISTFMRSEFGQTVWLRALLAKPSSEKPIIIDDLRLRAGKELVESLGFLVIRLDIEPNEQRRRLIATYGHVNEAGLHHETETDLDEASFSCRIDVTHKNPLEVFETLNESL